MSPEYVFLGIISVLLFGIIFFAWYSRYKKINNIGSGFGLQLFLISIPESQKTGENLTEALKNFISEMEKFISGLSGLKAGNFRKAFWGAPAFTFEIAAHNTGNEIFFYVSFPRKLANLLQNQLHGAFPDAKIEAVHDYNIFNPVGASIAASVTLEENSHLPIKTYQKFSGDPLETITSAFSKLHEYGEGAALQIVLRPRPGGTKKEAHQLIEKLKEGKTRKDLFDRKGNFEIAGDIFKKPKQKKPEAAAKPHDEEAVKMLEEKSSKMIFDANIRILSSAATSEDAERILNELEAIFLQYANPGGNSFKVKELSGWALKSAIENFSFRIFDDKYAIPLSVEEVASVYHFPFSKKAAPQVRTLKSREAPPPVNAPKEGIILGKSSFRGESLDIRISKDDRRRHFYIIGQTGTGKSVLMQNMIAQDIRNGEGVAVIDPHGELIEKVLGLIPKERAEDVVYFNPGDTAYPMGLNMLEFDPERPEQRSLIVNELLEIFNKLYNMSVAGGPAFEQYFRNATMLVMEDPQSGNTLLEIVRVFADKAFREYKLSKSKNIIVNTFWRQIAEKATGEQSLQNYGPYVTNKFDTFLSNEIMRPIIAQEKSAFNVRDVMDQKKILLLNLSKGRLGDLNSSLLGLIMVGKILMAALSRVDVDESKRPDFYLYIDEFQNVTTKSIATILSEARKYRLDMVITHQFIGQLEEDIKKAVFGNVGSLCSFRIGSDDGEYMEKQFEPIFASQDLLNIDNFNAYLKLLIGGQTSKPFNFKTIPPEKGNTEIATYIKQLSRQKYGRPREEVEEEIRRRHQGIEKKTDEILVNKHV